MVSPSNTRCLLLAVVCTWGLSATAVMANGTRQSSNVDRGDLALNTREEKVSGFLEEIAGTPRLTLQQKWAALSPDERDQLRDQVRQHWRQMTPEQRQRMRDVQYSNPAIPQRAVVGPGDPLPVPQQRFTPDERQQFHQWMRERRNGG